MSKLFLAVFVALNVTAAIAPAVNAAWGQPESTILQRHGPYDNTGNGTGQYNGGDGASG